MQSSCMDITAAINNKDSHRIINGSGGNDDGSRKDKVGDQVITTFDLRMTSPNEEPVMNTAELHTLEHLAATYLRIYSGQGDKVIYFGPMGCRTGCYFLMAGD